MDKSASEAETLLCSKCNYESTLVAFFRMAQGRWYCPRCMVRENVKGTKIIYLILLILAAFDIGMYSLSSSPWDSTYGLNILIAILLLFGLIILHELSHAVVGLLVGARLFGIQIGIGSVLFQHWVGNFQILLRAFPVSGFCFCSFPNKERIRQRYGLMVAAGPAVHLLLLLAVGIFIFSAGGLGEVGQLGRHLFWLNLILLLLTLWPTTSHQGGIGPVYSDGLQLWGLWSGQITADKLHETYYGNAAYFASLQGDHGKGLIAAEEGLALYPHSESLQNYRAVFLMDSERFDECVEIWQAVLGDDLPDHDEVASPTLPDEPGPSDKPEPSATGEGQAIPANATLATQQGAADLMQRAITYNNYAWARMMQCKNLEDAGVARAYAERAFAMMPWEPFIRGTLATVMILGNDYVDEPDRAEIDDGVDLAVEAAQELEADKLPAYRQYSGSTYATAALGSLRLGDLEEAREYLSLAKRNAPEDYMVRQAAAEIEATR